MYPLGMLCLQVVESPTQRALSNKDIKLPHGTRRPELLFWDLSGPANTQNPSNLPAQLASWLSLSFSFIALGSQKNFSSRPVLSKTSLSGKREEGLNAFSL